MMGWMWERTLSADSKISLSIRILENLGEPASRFSQFSSQAKWVQGGLEMTFQGFGMGLGMISILGVPRLLA